MKITLTATGDYPFDMPLTLNEALTAAVSQHMKAYGLREVTVTLQAKPIIPVEGNEAEGTLAYINGGCR